MIENEIELGKSIKEEKDVIVIKGKVAKTVIEITATGKLGWVVCLSLLAVAVATLIANLGPGKAVTSVFENPNIVRYLNPIAKPTAKVLGMQTAISAILIAVAGGGVGVLNKLREYNIEKVSDDEIILRKKEIIVNA